MATIPALLTTGELNQTNWTEFDQFVQSNLEQLINTRELFERYQLLQKYLENPFITKYAFELENVQQKLSVFIDYSNLEEAIEDIDYAISLDTNYTINQLNSIVVFIQPQKLENIGITTQLGSFTITEQDIQNNTLGYFYVYLEPNDFVKLPNTFDITNPDAFWVYKQPIKPFVAMRVFGNKDLLNTTDFDVKLYTKTIGSNEMLNVVQNPTNNDFASTYDFVYDVVQLPPVTKEYDLQTSEVLTGRTYELGSNLISLGKYFFKVQDNMLVKRTYSLSSNSILEVQDQVQGYNVKRHYSVMNKEFAGQQQLKLTIDTCEVSNPKITFLEGSNGTVIDLPAIKTVTKYNIQQYGVGAGGTSFILLAFNDSSVEGVWFENINQMKDSYTFRFTPAKLVAIQQMSGQLVQKGESVSIDINYPSKCLIITNNTIGDVLTVINDSGEQYTAGGSKTDMLKIFQLRTFEQSRFVIQNNQSNDQTAVQILIEYNTITTPPIQLQEGYTYSQAMYSEANQQITNVQCNLSYQDDNSIIASKTAKWVFSQQQNQHILLTNHIQISKTPINQSNQQVSWVFAKKVNKIMNAVFAIQRGKIYSGYVTVCDRGELYEL